MQHSSIHAPAPEPVKFACQALSIAFVNAVDQRDYKRALSVFTEDAVFERWDSVFQGKTEIGAMLNARDVNAQTRHLCTNFEITQSPQATTSASGLSLFLFYKQSGSVSEQPLSTGGAAMVGEFHDHYQLTDGGWRIVRRKVVPVFTAD
ncbi:nuclear transport factor 2 family protein [Pseudomaricurvus alkylphenolicus]|uniref:nuclear transport factor 2 family protein n=1 Tax=Pseudomaricurvus alkylphenolicus TaxID=1306991 RepID=UPI001420A79D|nr:nuclear transport factor 2 family protein [Pseudomaricurvus alkylphenolicus]NIB43390.1 nuclear transport factor 2 family protein [Pseudomaricurvus alkylphenolicus]